MSDSIFWQNNKTFQYNDNTIINILSFENCIQRTDDYLPLYLRKVNVPDDVIVSNIELTNVRYEYISNEELVNIQNIENILVTPDIKILPSKFRTQSLFSFEMIPLRRNEISGLVEKIVYFECKISYTNDFSKKSKNSRNYVLNSKLADGKWYKFKVEESKMYKLTYSQILEMGFNKLDNLGVFGYGGMVEKEVSGKYIDDMPEIPILKVDVNTNSVFDEGDYILFYADGPHSINFNSNGNFEHEYNNYSEYSYYFLSNQGTWKQTVEVNSLQNSNVDVHTYDEYKFIEKDSLNLINSGRRMFWRVFDTKVSHSFSSVFDNVSLQSNIKVKVVMIARSNPASNFVVKFNGVSASAVEISYVSSNSNTHANFGTFNGIFTPSNNFNIDILFNKKATSSIAWLDYISYSFRRNLSLSAGFIQFRDINSVGVGNNARFVIDNADANLVVWNITDRFSVSKINGNYNLSKYEFIANADNLYEYVAFNPYANFSSPIITGSADVGIIGNQNLHSGTNVDLIIVSHPNFYPQALGIKALHEQFDDMSVVVTTPQLIYNEFSSGRPDVGAIRNYVKMYYDRATNNDELPKNLLLLGDGSYDNMSNNPSVSNCILTYQSFESLKTTSSYVTDDFYVLMDNNEGGENDSNYLKGDIDLGVGRIPVKTVEEAENYLNKLRAYYGASSYSNWKNNILLVSDDAEGGETSFQSTTNFISKKFIYDLPLYNVETIYLDDYEQVSTAQGHRYPAVNQALNDAINNGALLVNWIGHGNPKGWAHELILDLNTIKTWKNTNKYPIFMTGTCEFSPFDMHTIVTAGEEVLLNPLGGGIALFTTTRKVYGMPAETLSKGFIDNLFSLDANSNINTLGLSVAYTKLSVTTSQNKRDFILLGDPAIRPPLPKMNVKTTKINGFSVEEYVDTINSKTLLTIEGIIENKNGIIADNFNGVIYPIVYDKYMTYSTRGNDGYRPEEYKAQKNIIFKGRAKVTNGKFSFKFIVPVDIAYFFDNGKISYYATNSVDLEANGYFDSFIIGGASNNSIDDSNGPEIELFMNDERFASGGITNEKPILIAKIKDNSGVNTVGNGIGHDITMVIDDNKSKAIVLNKFYESAIDDFTSGEINYPMSNLSLGQHYLKLKAWDIFNNSNEKSIDFIVVNSSELVIDRIFNYPNPFSTNTDFYLTHNQPSVKLDVMIQIFTISGKHVRTLNSEIYNDGYISQSIAWDGKDEYGEKIAKGVYIYKVCAKSPSGTVVEKIEKLMILN